MDELKGKLGELRAKIQIKRAATGKTEEYELVGHGVSEEQIQVLVKRGRVHGAAGAVAGDGSKITNEE